MMSRSSVMLRFCWLFCSSPTRVLDYHGRYLNAKRQNEPTAIWWNAVACRRELQKMGDPAKEAQFCEGIYEGFLNQKQAARIYQDIYDDGISMP